MTINVSGVMPYSSRAVAEWTAKWSFGGPYVVEEVTVRTIEPDPRPPERIILALLGDQWIRVLDVNSDHRHVVAEIPADAWQEVTER